MAKEKQKTEKIPLLLIYKQDGEIKTETSEDLNIWELYGFLRPWVNQMGKQLEEDIRPREDDDRVF